MILLSACLAGVPCRMDGKSKPVKELCELAARGEAILACPEVLGGLPVPRIPSERQPDGTVKNALGEDVTAFFLRGAEMALNISRENCCTCAVLKTRSPSCGKGSIYDGSFSKTLIPGSGVCAELLLQSGIQVLTEEEYLSRCAQNGKETANL